MNARSYLLPLLTCYLGTWRSAFGETGFSIPRSEVVRCSQSGPLLYCYLPADMGVSNRWPSSISVLISRMEMRLRAPVTRIYFFLLGALRLVNAASPQNIDIRKKYPLEPRVPNTLINPQITLMPTDHATADRKTRARSKETAFNHQLTTKQLSNVTTLILLRSYRERLQDKIQKPHCISPSRKTQEL